MMIGYPMCKYDRLPLRKEADITWLDWYNGATGDKLVNTGHKEGGIQNGTL